MPPAAAALAALVAALMAMDVATGQTRCPSGYIKFNSLCYSIRTDRKTWHAARDACTAQGAILAEPKNAIENNFLKNQVITRGIDFWLGASDINSEGRFVWENSGTPLKDGFTDWYQGEPNNVAGNEDCLQLTRIFKAWNDNSCSLALGFACQRYVDVPSCRQLPPSSLGRARCDVTTEGGPWLVIQSRSVGNVPFNRPITGPNSYQTGFGSVNGDYWIGLETIFQLCPSFRTCELYVEVTYHGKNSNLYAKRPGGVYVARYGTFGLRGSADGYRLYLEPSSYDRSKSTLLDDMSVNNGQQFSTYNDDNDARSDINCAARFGNGGWWYKDCGYVRLNSLWNGPFFKGMGWTTLTGPNTAAGSRIMIRKRDW